MSKQRKETTALVRTPSKVRPVPIGQMRVPPELVTQRRFRAAHANYLAANLDLNKLGLPVINHRDGIYWVCDGQHRVWALKANGFEADVLDCEVYEGLSDPQMAEMFLGRDDRKAITPFDKFHVACTAGRSRENGIRRTVEGVGLKIGRGDEEDTIRSVGALGKVYDTAGAVVLGQALRVLKGAFAGDPASFDGRLIEGVGMVFNRYNGRTNEDTLTARLAVTNGGVRGVLRRAEDLRVRTGSQKSHCVAAAVVEIHNRGMGPSSGKRLPSWWKSADAA